MGMENKKIVAPAGVDVKSFVEGGLRIPEGYKGVIEDGVFRLVKQESEDERIRKHIIEILERLAPCHWDGNEKSECIAYLEKQKHNIELIQRSWYMEGYHDREFGREPKWVIKTGEGGPKYEKNEKYGQPLEQKPIKVYDNMDDLIADAMIDEISKSDMPDSAKHNRIYWINKHRQKPAEWNDADMREARQNLIACCRDWERGDNTTLLPIVATRARYFLEHLQQPAEWSEEDEKTRKEIVDFLGRTVEKGNMKIDDRIKSHFWFKFLDNIRPQPKVEWSEEDETMWSNLIGYLEGKVGMLPSGKERYIKWLKERFVKLVYPKPSWKPSEEQMDALETAVSISQSTALESLYNDLIKL